MSSSSEATSSAETPSPPPCAGCKHLRRRCVPSCAFAAYLPPEHGDQFAAVHKVFGASNVSKLLAEVAPTDRAGAVESLVYEARARLRDPAFGCVSYITVLEHVLKQGMGDVAAARGQLAAHVGAAAAFRPFDARSASPQAKRVGEEQLDATLRFVKEQDERMRAVRVAAAAQSAREQATKMQQASAAQQQCFPDGLVRGQQIVEASESVAASQAAREQTMMAAQHGTVLAFPGGRPLQQIADAPPKFAASERQLAGSAEVAMKQDMLMGLNATPAGDEVLAAALQMAHAQQLAAAVELTWNQNMLAMMQQDAAELRRDANVMMLLQQAVGGHGHPDLRQQTVQQLSAAAGLVGREKQDLMMVQQQQQGESYADGMPGSMSGAARNMAFQPGCSPDAEAFLGQQQPQPVNALGFQTGPSLPSLLADLLRQQQNDIGDERQSSDLKACTMPPWLADVPRRQQQNDGGGDNDDGQLSDLTAYFGIPGPNLPPNGSGSS